jgi:hypothetical protein
VFDSDSARTRTRTPREVNERIDRETAERVRYYATRPEDFISHRISELDSEWDIDRVLQVDVAGLGLIGAGLLVALRRRWLALPLLALSLVAGTSADATQPLLVALRQIGVRTRGEIELERTALRALRGDFGPLATAAGTEQRGEAALQLAYGRATRNEPTR